MLSVKRCNKILNKNGSNYSDQEVAIISELLFKLATMEYDYLKKSTNERRSNLLTSVN